jgi:hypothetical protein
MLYIKKDNQHRKQINIFLYITSLFIDKKYRGIAIGKSDKEYFEAIRGARKYA